MVNVSLGSKAIYGYKVCRDCIELRGCGTVITVYGEEKDELMGWIKQAEKYAKNRSEVCSYLEYMIDFGQYE